MKLYNCCWRALAKLLFKSASWISSILILSLEGILLFQYYSWNKKSYNVLVVFTYARGSIFSNISVASKVLSMYKHIQHSTYSCEYITYYYILSKVVALSL